MKRHILVVAILLAFVMTAFVACATPGTSGVVKFSERQYEKVEESQVSQLLDEAITLSKSAVNGDKVVSKLEAATALYYKNDTSYTVANINSDLDTTSLEWAEKAQYCYEMSQKIYKLIRACEKTVFVSTVSGYCIEYYGKDYVDSVLMENLNTDEQNALFAEENRLVGDYSLLYAAGEFDKVNKLYVSLIKQRLKIAQAFGYDSYADYAYENVYSRDYMSSDAVNLITAVKEYIVPVMDGLKSLNVDDLYYTALSEKDMLDISKKTIKALNAQKFNDSFNYMIDNELYNVKVSSKKANTSYVTKFNEYDDAFLFLNAEGNYSDLGTMFHEFGHYNEVFMSDSEKEGSDGFNYDLAETHSQGMEVITSSALESFMPKNIYDCYVGNQLHSMTSSIVAQALFEEFEQYVYSLTSKQLEAPTISKIISDKYISVMSLIYPAHTLNPYYAIPHFFQSPFYCISYSVSALAAVQFGYVNFGNKTALEVYKDLVSYGTNNAFMDTLNKVGLKSPFEESNIHLAAGYLQGILDELKTGKDSAKLSYSSSKYSYISIAA